MLEAGALGYVLEVLKGGDLETAINTVAKREKYYSNAVSVTMINSLVVLLLSLILSNIFSSFQPIKLFVVFSVLLLIL